MRMSKGVEWAVHACAMLAPLPPGHGLSLTALAEFHGVPLAYMAKQLQALSRAGLVSTRPGRTGGYRLARAPEAISLWDVVAAIDGPEPAFRCTEIRQNGPCAIPRHDCVRACPIAAAFAGAEQTWRAALKAVSLADILLSVAKESTGDHLSAVATWYGAAVTRLPED
jgi:Rrf2 family protein